MKRVITESDSGMRLRTASFAVAINRNEAVILNFKNNCFHGLNESATFVLEELRSGKSIAVVERDYCERYGVAEARAREDIAAFCDALAARSLLSR